jgi:hypothetical protein
MLVAAEAEMVPAIEPGQIAAPEALDWTMINQGEVSFAIGFGRAERP